MADKPALIDVPLHFTMAASTRPSVEEARRLLADMLPKLEAACALAKRQGGFPVSLIGLETSQGYVMTARFGAEIFLANLRALVEGTAEDKSDSLIVVSGG